MVIPKPFGPLLVRFVLGKLIQNLKPLWPGFAGGGFDFGVAHGGFE